MIDFSTAKSIVFRNKAVKKISDALGKVLWEVPVHEHSFAEEWIIDRAATCTVAGQKHRICSTCGHIETAIIPATGHKHGEPVLVREPTCTKPAEYAVHCTVCGVELNRYEDDGEFAEHIPDGGRVTKEPTCTTAGTYTYYCRECDTWVKDEIIPALGHTWSDPYYSNEFSSGYGQKCTVCGQPEELTYVECEHPASAYHESVITNPTCTTAGSKTCSCDVCRSSWSVTIPALGHKCTSKVTAPTCTTKGYTTNTCSVCGHSYTSDEKAALGHKKGNPVLVREATCTLAPQYAVYCTVCGIEVDRYEDDGGLLEHVADGGRVTTQPTCVATGIRKYYCRECSTWVRDEVVPATGVHTYKNVVTSPTCTAYGYTTHTCTVCGYSYKDAETEPNGHFWGVNGGWVTVTPATCVSKGTEKHTCNSCGLVETRDIAVTGHSYTSKVTAPTCTAKGYTTHTCTVCGYSYTDNETDPNGHNFIGGWMEDKAPTCTEGGTEKRVCLNCKHTEHRNTEPLGHNYEYDYTKDATCTDGGYDVFTCTRCKDWYTTNETEANGHDFSDGWVTEKEATCEKTGTERKTCATCGYWEERDIPLADHDYEAIEDSSQSSGYIGVCRVCGDVREDHTP